MADKIRLGIVGTGKIARLHVSVLKQMSHVDIVGVTSRTKGKAQGFANEYGISLVADDVFQLVETAKPDALLVLVSADQIYNACCQIIPLGLPLFLEKPPGLSAAETWRLAQLADGAGIQTMVGYNRRYYSIFHKGLDIIKKHGSLLGVMVEGHERMGQIRKSGSHSEHVLSHWLYANATHTIDLLRLFGGNVNHLKPLSRRYAEANGDQFTAVMEFESGALGTYVSHWLSPGGWRVALFGQGVTVEFKPLEVGIWTDASFQTHDIAPDVEDVDHKPGFYQQMVGFCDLVQTDHLKWPGQDLNGAYQTMQLADGLVQALNE